MVNELLMSDACPTPHSGLHMNSLCVLFQAPIVGGSLSLPAMCLLLTKKSTNQPVKNFLGALSSRTAS